MKNEMKKFALFLFGMFAFILAMGVAGTYDYREAVISSISCEAYNEIVEKVGKNEGDIVDEYMSHRDYYDSLP